MAELMQLDKAAAMVGKSEVTLRRLIKAGKIPFQKEKTLTGFIYMVDPEQVKTYYQVREGSIFNEDLTAFNHSAGSKETERASGPVRVAVADESGAAHEYWLKKSERYEERYNEEVSKHAQTREELGVWRGRAEQAQSMLMKLLPAPEQVEVRAESSPVKETKSEMGLGSLLLIAGLVVLLLVVLGVIAYLHFNGSAS